MTLSLTTEYYNKTQLTNLSAIKTLKYINFRKTENVLRESSTVFLGDKQLVDIILFIGFKTLELVAYSFA